MMSIVDTRLNDVEQLHMMLVDRKVDSQNCSSNNLNFCCFGQFESLLFGSHTILIMIMMTIA